MKLHKLKVLSLLTLALLGNKAFSSDKTTEESHIKRMVELGIAQEKAAKQLAKAAANEARAKELQDIRNRLNGDTTDTVVEVEPSLPGHGITFNNVVTYPGYKTAFSLFGLAGTVNRGYKAWNAHQKDEGWLDVGKNTLLAAASGISTLIVNNPSIHEKYPVFSSLVLGVAATDMIMTSFTKGRGLALTKKTQGSSTERTSTVAAAAASSILVATAAEATSATAAEATSTSVTTTETTKVEVTHLTKLSNVEKLARAFTGGLMLAAVAPTVINYVISKIS